MLELSHIGSFQSERSLIHSEEPLEEVWNHIERFGTSYLKRFNPDKKDIPWDDYLKYTQIRTMQSIEFRRAAIDATLLTAPLPLYYAFLNLTRAFLALGPEIIPKPSHGLRFLAGKDLLSSKAQFIKGTFTDYLSSQSTEWINDTDISLSDALGCVIELSHDFGVFEIDRVHVQPIYVRAKMNGAVKLEFPNYTGDFASNWKLNFPELADTCVIFEENNTLLVNDESLVKDYESISLFLEKRLHHGLTFQNHATWYAVRKNKDVPLLPRAAYYYVAMFILGSIVRYQPELLLSATTLDSEIGWLLKRFLKLADRFFPQLKLIEFYKKQIYFSGNNA